MQAQSVLEEKLRLSLREAGMASGITGGAQTTPRSHQTPLQQQQSEGM